MKGLTTFHHNIFVLRCSSLYWNIDVVLNKHIIWANVSASPNGYFYNRYRLTIYLLYGFSNTIKVENASKVGHKYERRILNFCLSFRKIIQKTIKLVKDIFVLLLFTKSKYISPLQYSSLGYWWLRYNNPISGLRCNVKQYSISHQSPLSVILFPFSTEIFITLLFM